MYQAFEVITQIYIWMDLDSKDFEKHTLGSLLLFFFFFFVNTINREYEYSKHTV